MEKEIANQVQEVKRINPGSEENKRQDKSKNKHGETCI